MQKLQRIFIPFIILAVLGVIFFILYKQSSLDKGRDLTKEVPSPEMEMPKDHSLSSQRDQTVRANRNTDVNETTETSVNRNTDVRGTTDPPIADFATDPILKLAGTANQKALTHSPPPKRLKREGFFEYARQYARKAVAEDPESFEALLFLAQLLPPRRK